MLAARHTLRYPLLHAEYFSELEIVDGWMIYRVLDYHKQCTAAALKVATDHTWIREEYAFFNCTEANSAEHDDNKEDNNGLKIYTTTIHIRPTFKHQNRTKLVSVHPWWTKFMASTKVALSESIYSETIRDTSRIIEAMLSASQCSRCRRHLNSDFSKFLDAFVNEVEARVTEVSAYVPLSADPVILLIYTDLIDYRQVLICLGPGQSSGR